MRGKETPSTACKEAGLDGLEELSKITGASSQTLINWWKNKLMLFDTTLVGASAIKKQSLQRKIKTEGLSIYTDPLNEDFSIAEYNGEKAHNLGYGKGQDDTVLEALTVWGLSLDEVIVLVENSNGGVERWMPSNERRAYFIHEQMANLINLNKKFNIPNDDPDFLGAMATYHKELVKIYKGFSVAIK